MSIRRRAVLIGLTVILILSVPLGRALLFTVDERELAVVLEFGRPVASRTEPGLYLKIPFIQQVRRLPKTYQFWSASGGEIVVDLPTADTKKIEVTPWAVWKITDPQRFVEVLVTVEEAESRVKTFVRGAVRDVITRYDLVEVVRSTDRELTYTFQVEDNSASGAPNGSSSAADEDAQNIEQATSPLAETDKKIVFGREKIVREIRDIVQKKLDKTEEGEPAGRGIELVDVGISRIDFVETVRQAAFQRLIAFMESIASRHENEGQRLKQEILNQTDAEVQRILGEGSEQADTIRGQIDKEIIAEYARAIEETGDFYFFIRTLEAYEDVLGGNTRLILTTDSELFRLLKEIPAPAVSPAPDG